VRGVVTALVSTLVLSACGAAFAGSEAKRPTLRIVDLSPLTVRGTNFKAAERVKLLVNAGGPISKSVKAGPRGGFLVRLGVRANGCGVVVQAIGARGSRAMVDMTRPGCDERPE
jgi:hypothetical protein